MAALTEHTPSGDTPAAGGALVELRSVAHRFGTQPVLEGVDLRLDPGAFTIKTAIERMERLGADPMARVLEEIPDLGEVLQTLAGVLSLRI